MKQRDKQAGIPEEPVLHFEFASSSGEIRPLLFERPKEVLAAHTIGEVVPCLERVEEAVSAGYYAAGFLTFESAPAFDPAFRVREGAAMPLAWFGIFEKPLEKPLTGPACSIPRNGGGGYHVAEWVPTVGMDEYREKILAIKRAIERGETYQINYTIRLRSAFAGDGLAYYHHLKKAQSSRYCAYLNIGGYRILSASPELFFHLKDQKITVRPMKGTVKRGATPEEDRAHAEWLYHSEKNRAENLMIVDLLRNDLNRIARTGTVRAEKLFEIERYPTVHQMTSTVTAELPDHTRLKDIMKALFPTGSITGAPKVSSMKIIADLESSPREVYCGTIGYITPDREAVFNVPIRTVVIDARTGAATYGVGGGITWDSTPEEEYEEALVKARLLTWRGE
jgi:para-aminobenzoate synthetase/4-amino-4-deoxychorismate lyase